MGLQSQNTFINYYDILEVNPQASSFEVYQAYLKVKKTYSLRDPEMFKNFSFDEIQDLLTMIEEAYSTIGNQETRVVYDSQFFQVFPHLQSKIGKIDFTEATSSEEVLTTPPATPAPPGFAKTSLSTYEVDESFEAQILNQEFFDGVFLGKIRKYKKVKLEDFAKLTCIGMKYLSAIEENNYNALPAAVFTRGYIFQYCKILQLDADKVVTTYMKLYQNGRE